MNDDFEDLLSGVPGAQSKDLLAPLRAFESRNVTYSADDFPIFWESTVGSTIIDVDGNRFLDLTSAFGVASIGHANPYVAAAIADQAYRMMHAMGDVHPTEVRIQFLERLAKIAPGRLSKTFLATTGAEAIEAAIKTAMLATKRPGIAAYRNGYHGLSFGTLSIGGIEKFQEPFAARLGGLTTLLDFPRTGEITAEAAIARTREQLTPLRDEIAAIVIEPIQGRGGCIVPPAGYLKALRALATEFGMLLIFDEIYTGFGRTGTWFACQFDEVVPDILCLGKAMGSGFPISAAIATPDVMDAWPESTGEALHTSTYLGNPMGCAAALATIHELDKRKLPERARMLGMKVGLRLGALRDRLGVVEARGRGLMWGLQLRDGALAARVVAKALGLGLIVVQSGPTGDTIAISPPLVISEPQLLRGLDLLEAALAAAA